MSSQWDDESAEGSLWSRSFDFDDSGIEGSSTMTTKTLSLLVEEEWNAGIGGTCWEGGVLLARFLSSPAFASLEGLPSDRPLRAIELGSGVSALPCLVAARLTRRRRREREEAKDKNGDGNSNGNNNDGKTSPSSSPLPLPLFSEIFATDIDECLPGLEANAVKNAPATTKVEVVQWEDDEAKEGEGEGKTRTAETSHQQSLKLLDLDWRLFPRAATGFLQPPFDVVLVADAVYIPGLMPALVEAMRSVSDEQSFVFLSYYLRSESADLNFWPRLRAAFEVDAIPAASFGCEGADKGENRGLFRLRKRGQKEFEEAEEKRRKEKEEEKEEEEE